MKSLFLNIPLISITLFLIVSQKHSEYFFNNEFPNKQPQTSQITPHYKKSLFFKDIRVPQDFASIQDAVNEAQTGDIIILSPGIYNIDETIVIDKQITLTSEFINSNEQSDINNTVITSSYSLDPLVLFTNSASNSKCIGITFKEAHKQLTVECEYIEVTNCYFFDNVSDALSLEGAGGYIAYNYFENCGDEGIDADDSLDWIIEYNTIINPGDDGIEIRLQNNDGATRLHTIRYNFISGAAEDGIQLIDYDGDSGREFDIHHNLILNSEMVGIGCTINGNTIENYEGSYMVEKTYVYNNVFDNNNHAITGANNMLVINNIIVNSSVAIKNLENNSIANYNCIYSNNSDFIDVNTGSDNIFIDPMLKDNYFLEANSPCIDSGIKTYSVNGLSMTVSDEDILGDMPDMGAKEYGSDIPASNMAPIVSAGFTEIILEPNNMIILTGEFTDDGLPENSSITVLWTVESAPQGAKVSFSNPNELSTEVSFEKQGTYELRLLIDDGEKSSSDKITIYYVKDFNDTTVSLSGNNFIEAEDYHFLVGGATVVNDKTASEGQIVKSLPNEGFAYTEYKLQTFSNGTYYIWVNASGPDSDSNGINVSFNNLLENFLVETTTYNKFDDGSWIRIVFTDIPEGVYPLRISAAEEGVSWDRIFISTDENETPFNLGKELLSLYPVPNNGQFNILLKDDLKTDIKIFNIQGQLVYSDTIEDKFNIPISMEILEDGIYLVNIKNTNGDIVKKIIVN